MPQRGRRQVDDMLLMALACGATLEAAGQKAGISKATVQRRLKDPGFQGRLQEFQAEMVKRLSRTLIAAGTEAMKTLLMLLQPTVPPAVRLGASRTVLEIGIKMREVADLEERMQALEAQMSIEGHGT